MREIAVLLGLVALASPVAGAVGLAAAWVGRVPLREVHVARAVVAALGVSLGATICLDVLLLLGLTPPSAVLARWAVVPGFAVDARVVFDVPAAVLLTLTTLLTGLIAGFSATYLHREPGFLRFYLLLSLFASGMMAVACAETLDLLFAGWEVVGLTSALLIGFFHGRVAPLENALVVFGVYRVCDVALLSAAVLVHHHTHDASVQGHLIGPIGVAVAALLGFAALGKAAALPFTNWLARAMEGPTPSSAIFYGALSIHAGPFLLIRTWPLLVDQVEVRLALGVVGASTALYAGLIGRVQTDVKSGLAFASAAQAGVILVEVAAGLHALALVHIAVHALVRTWQLLRAPARLADWLEATVRRGGPPPTPTPRWPRVLRALRRRLYTFALERAWVDFAVGRLRDGVSAGLRVVDRLDRAVARSLAGPEP